MYQSAEFEGTKVLDDVLEDDAFTRLANGLQTHGGPWLAISSDVYPHVWSAADHGLQRGGTINGVGGEPLAGDLAEVLAPLLATLTDTVPDLDGRQLSMLPYFWPPGTGINWHVDSHFETAFSFYLHRRWNAEWGGEFLQLRRDSIERDPDAPHLFVDNEQLSDELLHNGVSYAVMPRPNRLVINPGQWWHKVAATATNAGNRFSLQGFIGPPR